MLEKERFSPTVASNGISTLKDALARTSRKHSGRDKKRGDFRKGAEELPLIPVVLDGTPKEKNKLARIVNETCRSEAGRAILEAAAQMGYSLRFDESTVEDDSFGYADPVDRFCALNPRNSTPEAVVTLAHELRHAFQYESEAIRSVSPDVHDTKTKMMVSRATEADAEAYGCLVAWELKEAGRPAAWNDFIESYPEIVVPFENAVRNGSNTDEARTAAFLGWYDNSVRRNDYDKRLLKELQSFNPSRLNKKLKSLPARTIIAEVCRDPQRTSSYFTKDPATLESGKYAVMYEDVKRKFERYFEARSRFKGRLPDVSLASIPTEPRPYAKKKGKAVGPKAKRVMYQSKQMRAARIIRDKKREKADEALVLSAALKKTAAR